jgi:cystathionine beta-lyase
MNYDFDRIVNRKGTDCLKHDFALKRGRPEDVLSLWVADMDFPVADVITNSLSEAINHGIYGYFEPTKPYYDAISNWFESRFDFPVKANWVVKTPGVVFALATAVKAFTNEGDSILIQRPVYYPFTEVILENNRKLINNPLVNINGHYEIDFDDFEAKITQNDVRMFILCSPHNPVGRVWKREELLKMAEICLKNNVIIVSDEIHCDFVYGHNKHTILSSLSDEIADNTVLCTAPSKTFNIAGLQNANIVIKNTGLRHKFRAEISKCGYSQMNGLGLIACRSAYENGGEWLSQLIEYLSGNIEYVSDHVKKNLPGVKMIEPEGTYLVWLDFRKSGISPHELDSLITHKSKLWLDAGEIFGDEGYGFTRINIACPRKILNEAMARLRKLFEN